jgi:hypothetical protein
VEKENVSLTSKPLRISSKRGIRAGSGIEKK